MLIRRSFLTLAGAGALCRPAGAQIGAPPAGRGRRVALVIGNGAYRFAPPLPNPPEDARSIAAKLQALGFETNLLVDASLAAMQAATQRLGQAADGAEACLLFYAGHALEMDGRNYLIPVAAQVQSAADVAAQAFRFDEATSLLSGRARTTLVFLDSCRDSPFPAASLAPRGRGVRSPGTRSAGTGPGLASVSSSSGMLIAFATAPGNVALDGAGAHSPFTTGLLDFMATPAIEVRDMLGRVRRSVRESTGGQQIPWDNSSLEAGFYMAPSRAGGTDHPTQLTLDAFAKAEIPVPPGLPSMTFVHSSLVSDSLVGSWTSGERGWGGQGRKAVLLILSADPARGAADLIHGEGPATETSFDQTRPARFRRRVAKLTGAAVEWVEAGGTTFSFVAGGPDHGLLALRTAPDFSHPNRRTSVRMTRIE